MNRSAMRQLLAWQVDPSRRPLLLRGARQVGKTWLMQEFGATCFERTAYVRFDHASPLREIFSTETKVDTLLDAVQLHAGFKIEPASTLLVFDEIQECPGALASLKFFCEDKPELAIVAAGSQLGLTDHVGTGFPVGKVDTILLHPMTFAEFLDAMGKKQFAGLLDKRDWKMISAFHNELGDLLKRYLLVGGMPKIVDDFAAHGDYARVRRLQDNLLTDYRNDFGKHAPPEQTRRLNMVWDSLPAQLSKENKKFLYKDVQPGWRSRDLELAMQWLLDTGLMRHTRRVSKPDIPLDGYRDGAFKAFMLDVGLLAAKSRLPPRVLLEGNRIFEEFKGALTEQFVQQEMLASFGDDPHYWAADRGKAEIDFLFQGDFAVAPVEVKSSVNVQAKSLRAYCEKFRPPVAVRASMVKYYRQTMALPPEQGKRVFYVLIDLPLYAVNQLKAEVDDAVTKADGVSPTVH